MSDEMKDATARCAWCSRGYPVDASGYHVVTLVAPAPVRIHCLGAAPTDALPAQEGRVRLNNTIRVKIVRVEEEIRAEELGEPSADAQQAFDDLVASILAAAAPSQETPK